MKSVDCSCLSCQGYGAAHIFAWCLRHINEKSHGAGWSAGWQVKKPMLHRRRSCESFFFDVLQDARSGFETATFSGSLFYYHYYYCYKTSSSQSCIAKSNCNSDLPCNFTKDRCLYTIIILWSFSIIAIKSVNRVSYTGGVSQNKSIRTIYTLEEKKKT